MKLVKLFLIVLVLVLSILAGMCIGSEVDVASGFEDWTRAIALIGQDPDGNLILIQVDGDGRLSVPFQGQYGGDLVTIEVDSQGRLYARMIGLDGTTVRNVAVDGDGQIIMVPRGQSGNYMLVDSDGFLAAVMKAQKADTSLINIAADDDGQMIMVPRGQSGNYLAIDSDGYLVAVLKGSHGGDLVTIGLDAAGRITAYMADDLDLWGQTLVVGNAELSARLGSPVTWDRRGQVQAVFDFGKGFHGIRQVPGAGDGVIELSAEHWQYGGYSVKLTGDASSPYYSYIGAYMAVPPTGVWGCAIHWSAELTPSYLEMRLEGVIENTFYQGRIRYAFASNTLQFRNAGAQWVVLGAKDLEVANYIFHRMKVVIDLDNEVFVRALLNNTQYDMSQALTTSAAPTVGDYARCEVYVHSNSGENDVVYLDTLIFTVKEPV